MKIKWAVLGVAGLFVAATWAAVIIAKIFFEPSLALWTALVTAGALSLEGFFWVAAGVLGWSMLAGRRRMLERLRQRFFG